MSAAAAGITPTSRARVEYCKPAAGFVRMDKCVQKRFLVDPDIRCGARRTSRRQGLADRSGRPQERRQQRPHCAEAARPGKNCRRLLQPRGLGVSLVRQVAAQALPVVTVDPGCGADYPRLIQRQHLFVQRCRKYRPQTHLPPVQVVLVAAYSSLHVQRVADHVLAARGRSGRPQPCSWRRRSAGGPGIAPPSPHRRQSAGPQDSAGRAAPARLSARSPAGRSSHRNKWWFMYQSAELTDFANTSPSPAAVIS